jgi:hypothetical protein
MKFTLRMTSSQHSALHAQLFPGDGKEAAALLHCGRRAGTDRHVFTVRRVVPIPYDVCDRHFDRITWPTDLVEQLLADSYGKSQAIIAQFTNNVELIMRINIVALLHSIAANEQTWSTFLALHNEHPSIYPALQSAIGQVLASAQEAALDAYIDSIVLSVPCNMDDHREVRTCLTIFRAGADKERRHKLWGKAFQRWSGWSFNVTGGAFPEATLSVLYIRA